MRASTPESRLCAGRYSLCTIEGGTCQVGLTVMCFIVSLSSGVCLLTSPITIFVVQTWAPLCMTLSVKSGSLTSTCALPKSRGYQRQRSMLTMMVSICRSCPEEGVGARLAAQLREHRLKSAISFLRRAERVERIGGIGSIGD